jgi:hypothetical protein
MIRSVLLLVILSLTLTGCELFVVGKSSASPQAIERSQRTALGVVHLWKAELDSNNLVAVTELMRHPTGRPYLAVERYELADDIRHWFNVIGSKPITSAEIDTVSADNHVVRAKIDYIKDVSFSTVRTEGTWFVSKVR